MSIYDKLLELKKQMPTIYKDAKNEHLRFKYAKLSNILSAMAPVLNEVGLVVDIQFIYRYKDEPVEVKNKKQYWLRGILTVTEAETGKSIERVYDFLMDTQQNNDVQRTGSTYTYAQRYIYGTFFGIAFDDDDPDTTHNTRASNYNDRDYNRPYVAKQNDTATMKYLTQDEYTELFEMAKAKMDKDEQVAFLADYEIGSWRAIPKELYATIKKGIANYTGGTQTEASNAYDHTFGKKSTYADYDKGMKD